MAIRSLVEIGADGVAQFAAAATLLLTGPVLKRVRDTSEIGAGRRQAGSVADTFEEIYTYGSRIAATLNLIELRALVIEQEAARQGRPMPGSAIPFLRDVERIRDVLRAHLEELKQQVQNPRSPEFLQAVELFQKRLRIENFGAEFASPRSGAWSFTASEWGPIADTLLRRAESKLPLEFQMQSEREKRAPLARHAAAAL